jgi:hypothetical protein
MARLTEQERQEVVRYLDADTALQMRLFDARGRQLKGWTNKLIRGHNKLILSSLKKRSAARGNRKAGWTEAHLHRFPL